MRYNKKQNAIYRKIESLRYKVCEHKYGIPIEQTPYFQKGADLICDFLLEIEGNRSQKTFGELFEESEELTRKYIFWKHTHKNAPYMYYIRYSTFVEDDEALLRSEKFMTWRRIREAQKKNVVSRTI